MAFTRDDIVKDTPTNTFATWNSIDGKGSTTNLFTFSEGNTKVTHNTTGQWQGTTGTLGVKTGKWYYELQVVTAPTATTQNYNFGFVIKNTTLSYYYYNSTELAATGPYGNTTRIYIGSNTGSSAPTYGALASNGGIYQVYLDLDNKTIQFGLNNTWYSSYSLAELSNYEFLPVISTYAYGTPYGVFIGNFGQDPTFANTKVPTKVYTDASGHGRFFYEPPAGAMALCTANLDTVNLQPAEYIVDETNQHILTYNGNAQISKFSPYATDGWSINFNGINQYLYLNKQAFDFGTGDFSFECFVYVKGGDNSNYQVLLDTRTGAAAQNFVLGLTPNNTLYWYSSSEITGTEKVPPFKWTHILFARSGSTLKMYVDGKESYSATNTGNFNASNTTYGYLGKAIQGVGWVAGYITEIRSVIGSCAYDISGSAITIPTSFLSVTTDTKLLISANNRKFLDTSTNNYDIFPVDGPSISDWSPYQRSNDFDTAFFRAKDNYYGGSFKFDGSGDWLTTNITGGTGSGDFTIEMWVYNTNLHNYVTWFGNTRGSTGFNIGTDATGAVVWYSSSARQIDYAAGLKNNSWYHIAFVRSSGVITLYLDGVSVATYNSSLDYSDSTFQISRGTVVGEEHEGYISDLRFIKGVAAYTSNFTPPTTKLPTSQYLYFPELLLQPWHTKTSAGVMSLIDSYAQDEGGRNLYYDNGGVSITTANPYKSSSIGSFIFDGSNNSQNGPLKLPKDEFPFYNVGNNDFTMEWWFKMNVNNGTGSSSYQGIFWAGSSGQSSDDPHVAVNNSTIQIYLAAQWQNTGFTPATGVWYHFALVRDYAGNSIKMFINGKQEFSTTAGAQNNYDQWNNASTLQANCHFGNHGGYAAFEGLITDIRFVNNQALYTTGFTPPAYPLLDNKFSITGENPSTGGAITGTVMLFTQPGTFTKHDNIAAQDPDAYMKSVIWTGQTVGDAMTSWDGTTGIIECGFQPDLVWSKGRGPNTWNNFVHDSVRGGGNYLITNDPGAENTTSPNIVESFNSSGFTIKGNGNSNNANDNYVAWCWKAGGAPSADGVAMVDGSATTCSALATSAGASITPTRMSVNTKAGFSIVKFVGTDGNGSIPHGLTQVPNLLIVKDITASDGWQVMPVDYNQYLNLNNGNSGSTLYPSYTADTQKISLGYTWNNNINNNHIAYSWHSVPGYSAFGSYTGNGSADGPFIYTGFKPAWVMIKRTDTNGNWAIVDNARSEYNVTNKRLFADEAWIESELVNVTDFTSNGFKIRDSAGSINDGTVPGTYIYAAFAEQPSKYSNAR